MAGSVYSRHSTLHPHQLPPIRRITLRNPVRLGLPALVNARSGEGNSLRIAPIDPVHGLHQFAVFRRQVVIGQVE